MISKYKIVLNIDGNFIPYDDKNEILTLNDTIINDDVYINTYKNINNEYMLFYKLLYKR